MKDTATQLVEIVEGLVAELRHAEGLISEQAECIEALEAEIALLPNVLGPAVA